MSADRASWLLAGALALGGPVAGAAADLPPSRITVVFVEPERFTDLKDSARRSEKGIAALLDELARFVRQTGERAIPADRKLEVRVTDVDMAGEFEPWRGPQLEATRFMREVYPPRIDLEFTLTDAGGHVVAAGKRALRNPLYLTRAAMLKDDRLRYEKELLREWLRSEFRR